jgi:hypothetical protein
MARRRALAAFAFNASISAECTMLSVTNVRQGEGFSIAEF